MFQQLVQSINDFPPLSDTAQLIHELHRSSPEGIEMKSLVGAIESDPILTANILRLINSPYYGLRTKVSTITRATAMLGVNYVYAITLKYAMSQSIRHESGVLGLSNDQFNNICVLQRSLLLQWYTTINAEIANYLAPLALMMELGKVILEKELRGSSYHGEYMHGLPHSERMEHYEQEFLGATTYMLTSELFGHWNLDPVYVEILASMDTSTDKEEIIRYVQIMHVIRTAVNIREQLTPESIERASEIVSGLGHSADAFAKTAKKLKILNETQFSRIH